MTLFERWRRRQQEQDEVDQRLAAQEKMTLDLARRVKLLENQSEVFRLSVRKRLELEGELAGARHKPAEDAEP